ncbi:ERAP1-like C-terminal domain-containing protein, partial [Myxococcota bacterium]|nr:ERAP1-like C-terminal domain-containing protein [Myxococcota bacterium]
WIQQPGFPVVSTQVDTEGGRTVLAFSQQRYFPNPDDIKAKNDQLWRIPLVVRYGTANGMKTSRFVLSEKEQRFFLPEVASWVWPNADSGAFFRTELDTDALLRLLREGFEHLNAAEKVSLLQDQWAMVRAGRAGIEQFMDVVSAYENERDHVLLRNLLGRLTWVGDFLVDADHKAHFQKFVTRLLAAQFKELGWDQEENEKPDRAVRRALLVSALGSLGRQEEIIKEASVRAAQEMENPLAIEANLAGTLIKLSAILGTPKTLESYVATYQKRNKKGMAPELQLRYLYGLAAFEKKNVHSKVLQHLLDGTVPQEQIRTLIQLMLGNPEIAPATWRFMKKNWADLEPRVGSMGLGRLVEATAALPLESQKDIERFFAKNPVPQASRAIHKVTETMNNRRELMGREGKSLAKWLKRGRLVKTR